MNHLAHLYLSQSNIDLMVGNFIADQVKGKQIESFSEGIQKGIRMHRSIDTFTDKHPIVMKSKKRLYANYHKYAAVIVDLFYDHLLARSWATYSPISLNSFAQNTYTFLASKREEMPERSKRILYYMTEGNWLSGYATENGIKQALSGLASRAKFDSKMEFSHLDLKKDYELYATDFKLFFPKLIEYTSQWTRRDD